MSNNIKYDAIVIGAGLTGLTVAYYLKKSGLNIKLLEKRDVVGGVIQTINEDGFVYETGPNSGVVGSIEAAELFDELKDKCKLEIANEESKYRWIWKNDKWNSLPDGIISGIKTELFDLKDKFKLLAEPIVPKGQNPNETIAELVIRRMGQSFLNYAVDPFISGVYAGNPDKLVTRFALPKLYNLEHKYGSFIGGSIKKKFEKHDPNLKKVTRKVFSMEFGLNNLVKALEEKIGDEIIETSVIDLQVDTSAKPYIVTYSKNDKINEIQSDLIISTVGGYALGNILQSIDKNDISEIINLKYTKVVQAVIGYKNWTGLPLKAFGGLVPSIENRKILGILFISSIFKNRAPQNGALFSVFLGGERRPDIINMNDDEIKQLVMDEISEMLQPNHLQPELLKIFRYQNAIPQYEISSKIRFEQIDYIENKYPGIILAGNIRNGIGMSDRIAQAKQVVDKILMTNE